MTDKADGHASSAAKEADAVDDVERNTKSQTTAASYTTTNHEVIRAWAEARGGRPAAVDGTESAKGTGDGILRIDFPHQGDDRLDDVDWDDFFRTVDDRGLSFVYQEQTSDGEPSRFNKFVRPDNER
jgi:hypothetical protein